MMMTERNRSSRRAIAVNNSARMSAGEKYHIRLPRTGLQSRADFITPLFLPNNYDPLLDTAKKHNFSTSSNDAKTVTTVVFNESSRQKVDSLAVQDPENVHSNATFSKSMIGGEQSDCEVNKDRFLHFDGDFEGGNLAKVEALELIESTLSAPSICAEYDIYIHNDPCHPFTSNASVADASWFFFRIQKTTAGCRYRFHVRNMTLPCDQEPELRPVSISEIAYQRNPTAGWSSRLIGDDISYYSNASSPLLCTLSFSLLSEFDDDSVYVALFAPYTYTHLQNVIHTLVHDPQNSSTLTLQTLCHSAAGNRCDLMVITESKEIDAVDSDALDDKGEEEATVVPKFLRSLIDRTRRDVELIKSKRAVVVVARQIASDTASSFACEGLVRFLLGPSAVACRLRRHFVFYVVPMLNPDGVINGLSRSDITGLRLDQQWRRASMQLEPTVYHCKRLLLSLSRRQDIRLRAFLDITSDDSLSIGVNLKSTVSATREDARIWARRFFVAAATHSALTKLRRCSIRAVAEDPDCCASVVVEDCDITLSLIVELSRQKSTSQLMNPLDFSRYGCIVCASLADIFLSDERTFMSVAVAPHYGDLSQSTVAEAVRDCVVSVDETLLREAKLFDDTVWDSNNDKSQPAISTVSQYPLDLLLFTLSRNVRFTFSFSETNKASSPLPRARTCSDQSDGDDTDKLDRDLYGEFLLERPPTAKNLKREKDVSLYYHSTSSKVLKQQPTTKGSFLSRQEIKPATISLTFQPDSLIEIPEKVNDLPAPEVRTEESLKDQELKSDEISNDLTLDTNAPINDKTTTSSTSPNTTSEPASETPACSNTTPLAVVGLSISEPEKTKSDVVIPVPTAPWNTRVGDRGLIKIKFHRPNYNQKGILGKSVGLPRGTVSFYVDKMKLTPLMDTEEDQEKADTGKVRFNEDVAAEEQEEEIDELKAMAELDAVLGRHSLPVMVGGPNREFQVVARVPSQKEIPSTRSPRIKTIHGQSSTFLEKDAQQFEDSIHDDDSSIEQRHPQIDADQTSNPTGDREITPKTDSDRAKSPLYYFGGNDFSMHHSYTENEELFFEKRSQSSFPSQKAPSPVASSTDNQPSQSSPSADRVSNTLTSNPTEREAVQSPSFIDGLFPLSHFMDFEPHHAETPKGGGDQSSNPTSANSDYNKFREQVLQDMGLLSGAGYRKAISRLENSAEMEKFKNTLRSGPHVKTTLSKTFPVRQQLLVQVIPNRPRQPRPSAPSRSTKVKGYAGIVSEEKLRQRLSPSRLPFRDEDSNPPRVTQPTKSAAYMRAEKALFYLEKDSEANQASISAQQIATFLHQELLLDSQGNHEFTSQVEESHDAISLGTLSSENDGVSGNEAKAGQRKWISFPSVPPDLRDTTSINNDEIIGTDS